MKKQYSRRDFLRVAVMGMGAFLASCMPQPRETPVPTASSTKTRTLAPEAIRTDTPTPTSTETAAETPTSTETPCFKLLTPEDGATLRAQGKVTFSWEAMAGAAGYKLEIVLPSGQVVVLDSSGTSYDLYIEVLRMGGEFQWRVTALDANGETLCITEEFAFHKSEYAPLEPTATNFSTSTTGSWSSTSNQSLSTSTGSMSDTSDQ